MRILILHLSDIHVTSDINTVLKKSDKIASVLNAHTTELAKCYIAFTGDMTNSGQQSEYDNLKLLLKSIQEKVKRDTKLDAIPVFVPGNHECDLSVEDTVRNFILNNINYSDTQQIDNKIIEIATNVQNKFFKLLNELDQDKLLNKTNDIAYSYNDEVKGCKILFKCYNTAWMSKKKEVPGLITIPANYMTKNGAIDSVIISMFHHPYNWFEPTNSRRFRKYIEETTDIILTGHEHESDSYKKLSNDTETEYIEGGVLQDSSQSNISNFNVIVVDKISNSLKYVKYDWNDKEDIYQPVIDLGWRPFTRNKYRLRNSFKINMKYMTYLTNPGASFTHRKKEVVLLTDIFVYPDLKEYKAFSKTTKTTFNTIQSKNVVNYVEDNKKIVIIGQERSGKTALAKMLFLDLHENGIVPIYMDASSLTNIEDELNDKLVQAVTIQYSDSVIEQYKQLPRDKKAIIIDNYHNIEFNARAQNKIIEILESLYDTIIITGNDLLRLRDLGQPDKDDKILWLKYKHCEILEFGYRLRSKLIDKWMFIGDDHYSSDIFLHKQAIKCQKLADTIIGKNLIPSYPLFILIILQQYEVNTPLSTNSGSFGYYYELLITQALVSEAKTSDIDLKYTYLSEIAYYMYKNKNSILSKADLSAIHEYYCKKYKIRRSFDGLINEFLRSMIIDQANHKYSFRYPYFYYYFIAKYMVVNLNEGNVKNDILELCDKIHSEENSNILIFLSYLSRDAYVFDSIMTKAKSIFNEQEPCNLEEHITFINRLNEKVPKIIYNNKEYSQSREEYLSKADELSSKDITEPDEELETIFKINTAMKTIEVLGQILKNRAGSLVGELKYEASKECYLLGLRTMNSIFNMIEKNIDSIIQHLIATLNVNRKYAHDIDKQEKKAKEFLFWISEMFSIGIIKKVSYSVGSEDLVETYEELLNDMRTTAITLIDICIKLDHLEPFPEDEIISIYNKLKTNIFAQVVLRYLTVIHFNLMPIDFKLKQRICNKLDIDLRDVTVTNDGLKKLSRLN